MAHLLKRRFLIMLALFVSLLPFSFSYGIAVAVPDTHRTMHQHFQEADCAQPSNALQCAALAQAVAVDDDCCSDHCDSSFGAHPGVVVEYGLQFPTGRQFQTASRIWSSDPIPSTLLRPPSARS